MAVLITNDAVLAEGRLVLIDDPHRSEHVWRRTRRGEKDVTVVIDLTRPMTAPTPSR